MEKLTDLKALLQHEIEDLISAEDQIMEALPTMIETAQDLRLKKALTDHLAVTEKQRARLDHVMAIIEEEGGESEEKKGFFSSLKEVFSGGHKCKGIEGIISEGEKTMNADMVSSVKDAAIIASAQKVEHYEICGYGTAKSYALQLGLREAGKLLDETLSEEYEADDLLTILAEGDVNLKAEKGVASRSRKRSSGATKKASSPKKAAAKPTNSPKKAAAKKANAGNQNSTGNKKVASGHKKVAAKKVASRGVKATPKKSNKKAAVKRR